MTKINHNDQNKLGNDSMSLFIIGQFNSNFMNLGRNQLLAWINQSLECQYRSIQMLADGVAFSQIIDALHPSSINMVRLSLCTRYPGDCLRNLRIVQSALKKLRISQPVSFQKISQGKFQDNIIFLQWLYSYSIKNGIQNLQLYQPYNRRLEILEKQGKNIQQINPHLIPTHAYRSYQNCQQAFVGYNQGQDQLQQSYQSQIEHKRQQISYKINQLKDDATTLEGELKTQMQTNWKLMHNIERSIQERNTLYSLLKQIETIIKQSQNSSVGTGILSVIQEAPQDFS